MTSNIKSISFQNEWLTPKQLEAEYGIKVSTQNKMRMARKLPYSKLGKFVRYSRVKINKMLEDAEVL
jgi:hypothetical protein